MHGLHLTADLRGCSPTLAVMTEVDALRHLCLGAVRSAGLQPVGELFHRFPAPGGITGVVLLAESHLAVHTWPELHAVTLDVYVCNLGACNTADHTVDHTADNSARAHALFDALLAAFAPQHVERHGLQRGAVVATVPT